MGLFGASPYTGADLYKVTQPTTAPKTTQATTQATTPKAATSPVSSGWAPSGLAAGPAIPIPRPAASAPAAPAPAPAQGPTYNPQPAQSYASQSGGGGGGGGSFDFSQTFQAPAQASMAQPDWSGLFGGMSSLMNQDQQGDVPGNVPLSTQKDTMQLQGLREGAAGWNDIAGPGSPNPALGQRILPDESKKLAALQTARIY